ncbi:MAG TPA: MGMT family protein [Actinomycetota bacterium]
MNSEFEDAVIEAIRSLGRGEIASYGDIARDAGFPGAARGVGNVLSRTDGVPWWRVVRADGRLVSPNATRQAQLLEAEGIAISNGRVALRGDA